MIEVIDDEHSHELVGAHETCCLLAYFIESGQLTNVQAVLGFVHQRAIAIDAALKAWGRLPARSVSQDELEQLLAEWDGQMVVKH